MDSVCPRCRSDKCEALKSYFGTTQGQLMERGAKVDCLTRVVALRDKEISRLASLVRDYAKKNNVTCLGCVKNSTCPHAYDTYNSDGRCIAGP